MGMRKGCTSAPWQISQQPPPPPPPAPNAPSPRPPANTPRPPANTPRPPANTPRPPANANTPPPSFDRYLGGGLHWDQVHLPPRAIANTLSRTVRILLQRPQKDHRSSTRRSALDHKLSPGLARQLTIAAARSVARQDVCRSVTLAMICSGPLTTPTRALSAFVSIFVFSLPSTAAFESTEGHPPLCLDFLSRFLFTDADLQKRTRNNIVPTARASSVLHRFASHTRSCHRETPRRSRGHNPPVEWFVNRRGLRNGGLFLRFRAWRPRARPPCVSKRCRAS